MSVKLVRYHGGDCYEIPWLKRLLKEMTVEEILDESQENVLENSIVVCGRLGQLHPRLLAAIMTTPGVTLYHISDEWYRERLDAYGCFAHVFRNYFDTALMNRSGITQLPLGPARCQNPPQPRKPVSERCYVWSFAGNLASTRRSLVRHLSSVKPNHIHVTGSRSQSTMRLGPGEYFGILGDSIFVPCPMGNVNLESFRLYEALDRGAIPIVERRPWLDYFSQLLGDHPLPSVNHWVEARALMQSLLSDKESLRRKQLEIDHWWQQMERNISNRFTSLLNGIKGQKARVTLLGGAPSAWRRRFEMLKHHNDTALLARSQLTIRRLCGPRA